MKLASHNSWTYLSPKKWWMKLLSFTAKCQNLNIYDQYKLGVRCFDLRVRFSKSGDMILAHGIIEYDYSEFNIVEDLWFLNKLSTDDFPIYIRVVNEVRNQKHDTIENEKRFEKLCRKFECLFPNLRFWYGMNLLKHQRVVYRFQNNPSCEELYASVTKPKIIDDWFPWLYARFNNKKNLKKGTDKDFMLIDFVNIT